MRITICGSMTFYDEMQAAHDELVARGHNVFMPDGIAAYVSGSLSVEVGHSSERKRSDDLIRAHFKLIAQSDAILVLNYDKNGIGGYVGANSFLEIGFAHYLGKKIYLLNERPDMPYVNDELRSIDLIVLKGSLSSI